MTHLAVVRAAHGLKLFSKNGCESVTIPDHLVNDGLFSFGESIKYNSRLNSKVSFPFIFQVVSE